MNNYDLSRCFTTYYYFYFSVYQINIENFMFKKMQKYAFFGNINAKSELFC